MSKWWMIFKQSLFMKFALAFLLVGLIPLIVLGFITQNQISNQVEHNTTNNFRQMVFYLSKNVDDIFRSYNELSKLMYYDRTEDGTTINGSISEIFARKETSEAIIRDLLKALLYSDRYIQHVMFVRKEDNAVFYVTRSNKRLDPNEPFPLVNWRYALESQPKKLAAFAPHLDIYFGSSNRVVTLARNLIDTSGPLSKEVKIAGTLYMDIDPRIFENLLGDTNVGGNDQIYILDGLGNVFYSNQHDKFANRLDITSILAKGNIISFIEPIPFLNGQAVVFVSKDDLYATLLRIRTTVNIALAVCLVTLIFTGILFSRKFSRPILSIIRQMVKVESGNLDISVEVNRNDELGRLAHGFNRMTERLKHFINHAYVAEIDRKQAEIKRKQAELGAIKNQIRPHYLNNTLEVIRMSALANKDDEVADMIEALSNQLRYVIDYGEEWVPLRRELDHLRDYFHLIEVRFDGKIKLEVEVKDTQLYEVLVPKLSLQPIVENAVQHGMLPKGAKGSIFISIEQLESHMSITIYDDGVGIVEEKLNLINERLNDKEDTGSDGRSIGLKNVHERIKADCGEGCGIDITSKLHIGTSIRMMLPIGREVQHENDQSTVSG